MNEKNGGVLLLGYDNPYWKQNPYYFGLLYKLVYEKPIGYHNVLLSKRDTSKYFSKYRCHDNDIYKEVYVWINEQTGFLADPFWELATKCYCIINGITSLDQFPKCLTDNKFIKQNVYSITAGFRKHYCSPKCRANNPEFKERMVRERCEKYGNIFGPIETIRKTKLERYGDENYRNSKKASETRINFSDECKAEIEGKKRKTWSKTLGVDNPMRSKAIREKHQESCMKNHGRKYGFDYELAKQTNNEKLGCDWPLQSQQVREKSIEHWLNEYGVPNPMQAEEVQRKQRRNYVYDSRMFDSKPELAYYVWLKENNFKFKYNESRGIPYTFNGKTHIYFPDFEVINNGVASYVEIKGSQFFREDGTMYNPFRNKDWTDAEYKLSCQQYEAKHQCMIKNNVHIIIDPSDEIARCEEYVEAKYGTDFWKRCRRVNSFHEERD